MIHKRNNSITFSTKDLDNYFIPKNNIEITEKFMEEHNGGVGYTKTATDHIFKRIKKN